MDDSDAPRQYVIAQIQDALAGDPRVNQLDVHVKLVGTKVFLTGCVPTNYTAPDGVETLS
jgi:osmotically-inducible protein OsmY